LVEIETQIEEAECQVVVESLRRPLALAELEILLEELEDFDYINFFLTGAD